MTRNIARRRMRLASLSELTAATWCSCFFMTDLLLLPSHLPNQTALLAHKHCLIPAVGSQYVAASTPLLAASFHIANLPMWAVHAMAPTASTATRIQPHLLPTPPSQKTPSPPSLPPLLQHLPAWEECLWNDPDREFILNGIVHGFSLIDPQVTISDIAPAHVPNNKSTCSDEIKSCIDDAVSNELISGGYIPCTEQPKIISALSAIPKPDGGVRLIQDLNGPADQSVNSYASKDYCKHESISDAIALIQPGWFMAVVDLKSAYRSVHIRPDEQCITGLQWQFSGQKQPHTMCDTRLPFAHESPQQFLTALPKLWHAPCARPVIMWWFI